MSAGITEEQSKLQKEQAEASAGPSKAEGPPSAVQRAAEEELRRLQRWQALHPLFAFIAGAARSLTRSLRSMHSVVLRLKYVSMGELLHKLGIADFCWGRAVPVRLACEPGVLQRWYDKFVEQYSGEFTRLYFRLKEHLETKKREDDWRRKQELMAVAPAHDEPDDAEEAQERHTQKQKQQEQATTLERLRRIGVDTSKGTDLFVEEVSDADQATAAAQEESNKQDVLGLVLLEHLKKCVVGIHSAELISGKSKLLFSAQGLELCDLLPELPSMDAVQKATQLRGPVSASASAASHSPSGSVTSPAPSAQPTTTQPTK